MDKKHYLIWIIRVNNDGLTSGKAEFASKALAESAKENMIKECGDRSITGLKFFGIVVPKEG